MSEPDQVNGLEPIAIIGMACRFPGAESPEQFWQNLCQGIESITRFRDQELLGVGVQTVQLQHPSYVKAGAVLKQIDLFDAAFFDFTPRDAELLDPQHRLFLECAWEVFERAGYDPTIYGGRVGMFAGCGMNSYLLSNLIRNPEELGKCDSFQLVMSNDKDFLPARVSYKLNLKGPSINVNTACSTSLVAVQMACQSLWNYQSDLVLAGGVTLQVPQREGYLYQDGGILSPDGHCRPFDHRARGTVSGSGVGIVALKRLSDALADGDTIDAVIRGAAINNDGSGKAGFTAPGVSGQAAVIAEAQALAGVNPESITYIEAHGTGTPLGDPIEVAALSQAFRARTQKKQFCGIGSVKSNFGHLDTAAGIAGLIKAVLAVKNALIPPTLHFEKSNPQIDFANSPFYVNTALTPWKTDGIPRRAGVSSFGIGGTNAHVIVEQPPGQASSTSAASLHLLPLSARTPEALETAATNLAAHLEQHPEINLADAAFTLQAGRKAFKHRRVVVCRDVVNAVRLLREHAAVPASREPTKVAGRPPVECPDAGSLDSEVLLSALGRRWVAGLATQWPQLNNRKQRRRLLLPTYPFERKRFWIDPAVTPAPPKSILARATTPDRSATAHLADWFYVPSWKRLPPLISTGAKAGKPLRFLIFADECGIAEALDHCLPGTTIVVRPGSHWARSKAGEYTIDPANRSHYEMLFNELSLDEELQIVHLWNVADPAADSAPIDLPSRLLLVERYQERGFFSLLFLAQAAGRADLHHVFRIAVVSTGLHKVTGEEDFFPEKAQLLGPARVMSEEYPNIQCMSMDVQWPRSEKEKQHLAWRLAGELLESTERMVAFRGEHRWAQTFERVRIEKESSERGFQPPRADSTIRSQKNLTGGAGAASPGPKCRAPAGVQPFRKNGVYWITGGLGGVGLLVAEHLSRTVQAKLILSGRSAIPPREEWESILATGEPEQVKPNQSSGQSARFEVEQKEIDNFLVREEARLKGGQTIQGIHACADLVTCLDHLCAAYILGYFQTKGVRCAKGNVITRADLRKQLGVLPVFDKFVDFFIQVLTEDRIVMVAGDQIEFLQNQNDLPEAAVLHQEAEEKFPEFAGLLGLLRHCAQSYPQSLSGETSAISVLYPEGRADLLAESERNTTEHSYEKLYGELLRNLVLEIAKKSQHRTVRILEIGGGHGTLTEMVLPGLRGLNVEYYFTDLGKSFVLRAEQQAAELGIDFMRFGVFDITRDPLAQGIQPGTFDFVLGFNVVHATPRIRETARNLRGLLVPGGFLALLETVRPLRAHDMIWGLAEGWWAYEDADLRPLSPLMSLENWKQALSGLPFGSVNVVPQSGKDRAESDCGLILARREPDGEVDRRWITLEAGDEKDSVRHKVAALKRLEALGSEVLVLQADVANIEEMRQAAAQAHERFGQVHGVVHGAMNLQGSTIDFKDPGQARRELAPKVQGTLVLDEIFRALPLDFMAFFSSHIAITGGVGTVGYCAASAFLDAFAQRRASQGGRHTVVINWDRWRGTGRAVSNYETWYLARTGQELIEGMSPPEAIEAFERILSSRLSPQVIVSAEDFSALVRESGGFQLTRAISNLKPVAMHGRPNLTSDFVPARHEAERTIAGIWQAVLGINQIGVLDDFSELGGDSLIAIQVISRLREAFGVELTVRFLYERPTIAALAEGIENIQWSAHPPAGTPARPEAEEVGTL